MIDLQPFCYPKDDTDIWADRCKAYGQPFRLDGKAYATDGRVMLQVEAGDIAENPLCKAENINKVFSQWTDGKWTKLKKRIPKQQKQLCSTCGGDEQGLCPDCNRTGYEEKTTPVKLGERYIDAKYLHLIATLPNLLVNKSGDSKSPISFKFDGGRGLLMPINPDRVVIQKGRPQIA